MGARQDYELRFPDQVSDVMDRGWSVANSTPKGPVYLSLPREVLCEACPPEGLDAPSKLQPARTAPARADLARAAKLLAEAERPLIIAQRGPGSQEAFDALTALVEERAIPVSHYWANQISIPMTSYAHVGWFPDELLQDADVVLVIDALAPWWPDRATPAPNAQVIQLGPDPLFARTSPMRSFRSDVTLSGETAPTLLELIDTVRQHPCNAGEIDRRRAEITAISDAERQRIVTTAQAGCRGPMTKDWVSRCLGEAIRDRTATVFHELGCPLPPLQLESYQSYFQEPHSGGLGWGLPAAIGAQLADPDRLIFATMGDGSYMFANPTACHQICEALGLPVITLVLNNEEWGAVRRSVSGLYKGGRASKTNDVPLTSLRPSPDFTKTAEASRAYTETVTDGAALPEALERAIKVATLEKRQVLLNIAIERDGAH